MPTLNNLQDKTDAFFKLHWLEDAVGQRPVWSPWDPFLRTPIPNFDKQGCYALMSDNDVNYVGLAVSKGWGNYRDRGISIRLYAHVLRVDKSQPATYMLRDKWQHITGICTIPFPNDRTYLAPALERFLIAELQPASNKR